MVTLLRQHSSDANSGMAAILWTRKKNVIYHSYDYSFHVSYIKEYSESTLQLLSMAMLVTHIYYGSHYFSHDNIAVHKKWYAF